MRTSVLLAAAAIIMAIAPADAAPASNLLGATLSAMDVQPVQYGYGYRRYYRPYYRRYYRPYYRPRYYGGYY